MKKDDQIDPVLAIKEYKIISLWLTYFALSI